MANYNTLKSNIISAIYSNTDQSITGDVLQGILLSIVDALGSGYQYIGIATTGGTPLADDSKVAYIASTAGTYTNYGGLVVASGEVALLVRNNDVWSKHSIGTYATIAQLNGKQNKLTAGNGISIINDVISVTGGGGGGISDAPTDGLLYVRKNGQWVKYGTPVATSKPFGGFLPNVSYQLGELTEALDITLQEPTDTTIANEYQIMFSIGSTLPAIGLPISVRWPKDKDGQQMTPPFKVNTIYEINIKDGFAYYGEF